MLFLRCAAKALGLETARVSAVESNPAENTQNTGFFFSRAGCLLLLKLVFMRHLGVFREARFSGLHNTACV